MTITTYCDSCETEVPPDSAPMRVSYGRNATVDVELCTTCRERIDGMLMPVLSRGVRVQDSTLPCPKCDRRFKNSAGLTMHDRKIHATNGAG